MIKSLQLTCLDEGSDTFSIYKTYTDIVLAIRMDDKVSAIFLDREDLPKLIDFLVELRDE